MDERSREVDAYLRFVRLIEEDAASLRLPNKKTWKNRAVDQQVLKILKANAFLLLYNLVEAGMRDCVGHLYEAVKSDGCTIRQLADQLRTVWIKAELDRLPASTSNQDSYRDAAKRLVQGVIDDSIASWDEEPVRFSGNLDARMIRKVCIDHGVDTQVRPEARGGAQLKLVKDKRNELAHGHSTFSECGRDFTASQLVGIKRETCAYLRGVIRSFERHVTARAFRVAS